jgi:hypothetical protein
MTARRRSTDLILSRRTDCNHSDSVASPKLSCGYLGTFRFWKCVWVSGVNPQLQYPSSRHKFDDKSCNLTHRIDHYCDRAESLGYFRFANKNF